MERPEAGREGADVTPAAQPRLPVRRARRRIIRARDGRGRADRSGWWGRGRERSGGGARRHMLVGTDTRPKLGDID